MKRQIDALIFDLDGTLVNSLDDLTLAVNHVLSLRGRGRLSKEEIRSYVGDGLAKLMSRSIRSADPAEIQSAIADFRPFYEAHCLDATALYAGVIAALDRFSSKRMAVVSNKPQEFTRKILEGLNVAGRFEIIWGPESVSRQKPDPESNLKIAGRFGVPTDRFCSIGDRSTDIEAGRAAGMMTVGVTYGIGAIDELKAARPDVLIASPGELEKYIE